MVVERIDAEAMGDVPSITSLTPTPRSSEAQLEAAYLASEEDAHVSLIHQLGTNPRKVIASGSCLAHTII